MFKLLCTFLYKSKASVRYIWIKISQWCYLMFLFILWYLSVSICQHSHTLDYFICRVWLIRVDRVRDSLRRRNEINTRLKEERKSNYLDFVIHRRYWQIPTISSALQVPWCVSVLFCAAFRQRNCRQTETIRKQTSLATGSVTRARN